MITPPHALRVAYDQLLATLKTAIGYYNYANSIEPTATNPTLLDDIDRFVEELIQVPGAEAELQRRARFVKEKCNRGTPFDVARRAGLASHHKHPPKPTGKQLSGAKLAIQQLKRIQTVPSSLEDLRQTREAFDRALKTAVANGPTTNRFRVFLHELRRIIVEAERLQVDGVRCLWRLHQGLSSRTTGDVTGELMLLRSRFGGSMLNDLRHAADSMMDWVEESANSTSPPPGPPNADGIVASTDFRSVKFGAMSYSFSANQAKVVEKLIEAWRAGTPDVGNETLLSVIDHAAPPERLNVVFRGHPAWGVMIVPGATKGTRRLADPPIDVPAKKP